MVPNLPLIDLSWHQPCHTKTFIRARNQFAKWLKLGLTCQKFALWTLTSCGPLMVPESNHSGWNTKQFSRANVGKFLLECPCTKICSWSTLCPQSRCFGQAIFGFYLHHIFVLIVPSLSEDTICSSDANISGKIFASNIWLRFPRIVFPNFVLRVRGPCVG